jgi:hypothetical protein
MHKKALVLFVFIAIAAGILDASAQCAMCKAVTSSNIEGESNEVGKGLNTGILYLMSIPYFLLMGLFYLFFKDKIKEKLKGLRKPVV